MTEVLGGRAAPLAVYAAALRRAVTGGRSRLTAVGPAGQVREFVAGDWCGGLRPGDAGLLARASGSTLDVGCGPGRLAGALAATGRAALGVDLSPQAVRLARRRGVPVLCRDVFDPVPGEGRWDRLLLADGNIGIGGDPATLLRRCRDLIAPDGRILVEVDPPGTGSWSGRLRVRGEDGRLSVPFRWAYLGADHLPRLAAAGALRICDEWTEAGRWFAGLCPA